MEQQSGYRDPMLDSVEVPKEAEHLWVWFWEIRNGVTGGLGPATITHTELKAWMENTGHRLNLWEQKAIWAMNSACIAEFHKQSERQAAIRKNDLGYRDARY